MNFTRSSHVCFKQCMQGAHPGVECVLQTLAYFQLTFREPEIP